MILKLKLQSSNDIITNSSSEIFQIKSSLGIDTVRDIIEKIGAENFSKTPDKAYELPYEEQRKYDTCSGEGGELSIYGWETVYDNHRSWCCVPSKRHLYTPEMWALGYEESLEELKQCIWVNID